MKEKQALSLIKFASVIKLTHFMEPIIVRLVYYHEIGLMMTMIMNYFKVWLINKRHSALFPVRKDPYHCKSPTHQEQDLNLSRSDFVE